MAAMLIAASACGDTSTESTLDTDSPPYVAGSPASSPPNNVVGGFSIQLPDKLLEPGQEGFPCWIFPLEVTGDSRLVGGGKLTSHPGMHHGNVTTRPKTGDGIRPCSGGNNGQFGGEVDDILDGGSVLFGSSTQFVGEEWQRFPDGMAYPISDDYEIVARMHYLNASSEPLIVAPRYEWYTIETSSVTHTLGPFAWALSNWEIPPLSTFTVSSVCRPPKPMHIVNAMPHMHALGTEFFGEFSGGSLDSERFLDSVGYDPDNGVIVQYNPAVDLSMADAVRFGCTWKNIHNKPIVEGVGDNEMCILFGYAYPYEQSYSAAANPGGCVMIAPP